MPECQHDGWLLPLIGLVVASSLPAMPNPCLEVLLHPGVPEPQSSPKMRHVRAL